MSGRDAPAQGPVCARCPRVLGGSCCEVKEGEQLATLTRADVERIRAHTGLAARRFVGEEYLTEGEAADYEARRPLYRGYFRRAPVRWTLRTRAGACVFHSPERGCGLPGEVRPVACRLYPFERWPDFEPTAWQEVIKNCCCTMSILNEQSERKRLSVTTWGLKCQYSK